MHFRVHLPNFKTQPVWKCNCIIVLVWKLSGISYDQWTPKGRDGEDRNIMETAVRDPILTKSKWTLLEHINQCRLYLKLFHISEMSDDGQRVDKGFLDGTKRIDNSPGARSHLVTNSDYTQILHF